MSVYRSQMKKVCQIFDKLKFTNEFVIAVIEKILREFYENGGSNLTITSNADQIILFTNNNSNNFKNLLIDNDCDMTYMNYKEDKTQSEMQLFFYPDFVAESVAKLLL